MNDMPLGLDLTLNEDGTICLPDGRVRTVHDGSDPKNFQELLENIDQPIQVMLRTSGGGAFTRMIVALSEREGDGPPKHSYLQKLGVARRGDYEPVQGDPVAQARQSEILAHMLEHYGFPKAKSETIYRVLQNSTPFTARARAAARLAAEQGTPMDADSFVWTLVDSDQEGSDFGQDYFAGRSVIGYPDVSGIGDTSTWLHQIARKSNTAVTLSAFIVPADTSAALKRLNKRLAKLEGDEAADAQALIDKLQRCEGKMVQMAMHIGISGELEGVKHAMQLMDDHQNFFATKSHTNRHLESRISTLPLGLHALSANHAPRFVLADAAAALVS